MPKFIRYALAATCLAASVGCLALWWGSASRRPIKDHVTLYVAFRTVYFDAYDGIVSVYAAMPRPERWEFYSYEHDTPSQGHFAGEVKRHGLFRTEITAVYFPLWYPALVFALAGVAALRFRRQFSIRSALITVSVVAALLGMVVAL
jgi:hypothetical protein